MHAVGRMNGAFFVDMEKQNPLPRMYINSLFLNQTGNDSQINTSLAILPQAIPQAVQPAMSAFIGEEVTVKFDCLKHAWVIPQDQLKWVGTERFACINPSSWSLTQLISESIVPQHVGMRTLTGSCGLNDLKIKTGDAD